MTSKIFKITGLVFLLNSGSAFSGTMETQSASYHNAKENFYFGVGLGSAFDTHYFSILNTNSGASVQINSSHSHALVNLLAGYGFTAYNRFYLGGELGTNFPRRTTNFNRQGVSPTSPIVTNYLSLQDYVTGDVLPGFRFNNFLIYGRLGLAYSHLGFYQDATMTTPIFEDSSNQLSERLGLGINYAVTPSFSLSVDYTYMDYQAWDIFFPRVPVVSKSKPCTNYVGLSLIYSF